MRLWPSLAPCGLCTVVVHFINHHRTRMNKRDDGDLEGILKGLTHNTTLTVLK
jgi:hypothetical protein